MSNRPATAPCVLCGRDATREVVTSWRNDPHSEVSTPACGRHLPIVEASARADEESNFGTDYVGTFNIL